MSRPSLAVVVRNWVNRLHVFDKTTGRFLCGRLPPLDAKYDFAGSIDEPGFDTCRQCRAALAKARGTP